jgi:preprotein translocase subunit SecA
MLDENWLQHNCSMKYLKDYIFTLTGGQNPQILGTESEEFDYFNNS